MRKIKLNTETPLDFIVKLKGLLNKKILKIYLGGDNDFVINDFDPTALNKIDYICKEISIVVEQDKAEASSLEITFSSTWMQHKDFGGYDYLHASIFDYTMYALPMLDAKSRMLVGNRALTILTLPIDLKIETVDLFSAKVQEEVILDFEHSEVASFVDLHLDLAFVFRTNYNFYFVCLAHGGKIYFSIYMTEKELVSRFLNPLRSFGDLPKTYKLIKTQRIG